MHIFSYMRKQVNRVLPDDLIKMVSYKGKILSTCFNVKHNRLSIMNMILCIMLSVQRNLVHMINYVNQAEELQPVKDHNCRDTSSHIFKHCVAADHQFVFRDDLRIFGRKLIIIN